MFAYILLVHLVRLLNSDPLVLTAAKLDVAGLTCDRRGSQDFCMLV